MSLPRFAVRQPVLINLAFALLIVGLFAVVLTIRRRRLPSGSSQTPLSGQERARLDAAMKREDGE